MPLQAARRQLQIAGLLTLFAGTCFTQSITSVSQISTQQSQSIVIAGTGFGTQSPYTGNSTYIAFFDLTKAWQAGYAGPCPAAFGSCQGNSTLNDLVTLEVDSWSNSTIVLGGFAGSWGANSWTLSSGDEVQIYVWNAQSGNGPASITTFVNGSFANVPGALSQISVGADGSVWGLNSSQQIYRYDSASQDWTNIPGALQQIVVGSSTAVWGLNEYQQIYRWDSVRSTWLAVPGWLTQIAVGADGDVWGINAQSYIYHYNAQIGSFSQVLGTLVRIAVGSSGAVYGVNAGGEIYWYNPGTGYFQGLPNTSAFGQISVGVDGAVWAVKNGVAYHYNVLYNRMDATPGSIAQVMVGYGAAVFGLNASGDIFQWNAPSQSWFQISGNLTAIAVGGNGAVWGINSSRQIYELAGATTRPFQNLAVVGGSATQISVGEDGSVWALNGNTVEYFDPQTQSFEIVSGAPPLTQLSVGAGADVWGINSSGEVFEYEALTGTWNNVPGQLNFIQVAANNAIWGINAAGLIFTYDFDTASWVNVPGQLATLSVSVDGIVWGVNDQQEIYRFTGGQRPWQNIPGSLVQVSVGDATHIWGVNAHQQVYRYSPGDGSWVIIPGASLVQICVAFDGSVWGVNAAGILFRWNTSAQIFDPVGTGVSKVSAGNSAAVWAINTASGAIFSWFGNQGVTSASSGPEPMVTLNPPAPGATQLSGHAYNVNPKSTAVVIYALTNQWYVQPFADAPFTTINSDGSWVNSTNPWNTLVILLVDPATYTPAATEITNPALDPGVLAWTQYPPGPVSVNFSGYTWGIKMTGNSQSDQFDPGPNFWSNDPSVVNAAADGLHLKISEINGMWQCGEVYLTQSLGYGTYTVHISSPLDRLDQNTVAAPLFLYAGTNQEVDNEYSGAGGLIAAPNNAQFVVQPYTVPGNSVQYVQPVIAQFTSQIEWMPDHVTFTAWNGWSATPSETNIIYEWRYTGSPMPPPGPERVHINLWLLNGNSPVSGVGDEMVINSFIFQPAAAGVLETRQTRHH